MGRYVVSLLFFSTITLLIYISRNAVRVKPSTSSFLKNDLLARFFVWYWPFGSKWKQYLIPEVHEKYKPWRQHQLLGYFVLIIATALLILSRNYYNIF